MSDRTKEKINRISIIVFIVAIALFSLVTMSFDTEIQRELTVYIYDSGEVTGQTSILINGIRTQYLLPVEEDRFSGQFAIGLLEATGRESVTAEITWKEDPNAQTIYYYTGGLSLMGVNRWLLVNEDMSELAVCLIDGRVLATSEEVYDIYTIHITYYPENGSTSIVGDIPEF